MRSSTVINVLPGILCLGVQTAVATCYKSGDGWPNTEEARSFINDACTANGGMFTGSFAPLQTKTMCPHASSNNLGLLFQVQNLNKDVSFDLGNNDCVTRLDNEIFGCSRGGESIVSGWRFRADPGAC